jgi:hypothetical protein
MRSSLLELGFARAYPQIRSGYDATIWERAINYGRRAHDGSRMLVRQIALSVLRKAGLNPSSEQLRETIANNTGLAGVTGRYDFKAVPHRGVGVSAIIVQRWEVTKGTWIGVSKPAVRSNSIRPDPLARARRRLLEWRRT